MSNPAKTVRVIKVFLLLILVIFVYLLSIALWNVYIENKLEKTAKNLRVGMSDIEVIRIMGPPKDEGVIETAKLQAGDWKNVLSGFIDCLTYREIQKIGSLEYYLYYNYLITAKLRKKQGSVYVSVYFDNETKKVVCVKRSFVI